MNRRIEDRALIGDTHTAALVDLGGTVACLCLPRVDAPACFAAPLGDEDNGNWARAPVAEVHEQARRDGYDPELGNFPQAFSPVAVVNSARRLGMSSTAASQPVTTP